MSTEELSVHYELVAASQTDQVMGNAGAAGDFMLTITCVVTTAATSQVQIKDGGGAAITILPNNIGQGVGTYNFYVGLRSQAGPWKITTAAGVAVIVSGCFT